MKRINELDRLLLTGRRSHHLEKPSSCSPKLFLEGIKLLRQRRISRTPEMVRNLYDRTQVDTSEVHPSIAETLQKWVPKYVGLGAIVEFGCGTGRNLQYLRNLDINNRMIGFDFSVNSLAIAKRRVNAAFQCCDVTKDFWDCGDVDVVFSVHAFEMMPRTFPGALANIAKLKPRAAVFIEPITELWPWSPVGLLARLRVWKLDRLRGFYEPASKLGKVVEASCFPNPYSWLNPSCLMVVEL